MHEGDRNGREGGREGRSGCVRGEGGTGCVREGGYEGGSVFSGSADALDPEYKPFINSHSFLIYSHHFSSYPLAWLRC